MDDKYTGCNIVESVVTPVPSPRPTAESRGDRRGFSTHLFARIIISALIIGAILVLHYYPTLPFFDGVTSVLKKVFCYDVFGRTTFGTTIFG